MTDRKRRVEALEQRLRPITTVPTSIMAQSRADADEQLRRLAADHPDANHTVFVMTRGPAV